jgi:hypothetical protein
MLRKKTAVTVLVLSAIIVSTFYIGTVYVQYGRFQDYGPRIAPTTTQDIAGLLKETTELSQERLVTYNAQISLETKDVKSVLTKIRSLAEGYGGYVAGSAQKENQAQLTVRVPKDKFQAAIQDIESYGKVLGERTTSEDVTERYIDLRARLENLQKQETRLRDILGMARTVEEILKVESELGRVRGQIESLQGQMNYLERSVAMSLIVVNLTEPSSPFTLPGMNWNEVFEAALRGLYWVLRNMIVLAVSLLPLIVIGVPAYFLYRKKWKGHVTKKLT